MDVVIEMLRSIRDRTDGGSHAYEHAQRLCKSSFQGFSGIQDVAPTVYSAQEASQQASNSIPDSIEITRLGCKNEQIPFGMHFRERDSYEYANDTLDSGLVQASMADELGCVCRKVLKITSEGPARKGSQCYCDSRPVGGKHQRGQREAEPTPSLGGH